MNVLFRHVICSLVCLACGVAVSKTMEAGKCGNQGSVTLRDIPSLVPLVFVPAYQREPCVLELLRARDVKRLVYLFHHNKSVTAEAATALAVLKVDSVTSDIYRVLYSKGEDGWTKANLLWALWYLHSGNTEAQSRVAEIIGAEVKSGNRLAALVQQAVASSREVAPP